MDQHSATEDEVDGLPDVQADPDLFIAPAPPTVLDTRTMPNKQFLTDGGRLTVIAADRYDSLSANAH